MRVRHAALGLSIALMTSSPPSAGQETPAPADVGDDQRATAYYKEGILAAQQADLRRAQALLLAAWELKKHFQIAANLGMTEAALGEHRGAAEHLSYFLRETTQIREEELRTAQAMLEKARRNVGAVVVDVSVPGAEILIDGRQVGTSPVPYELFVAPGRRRIEARLPGFVPAKEVVFFEGGASHRVALTLLPPLRPRAPGVAPRARDVPRGVRDPEVAFWPIGIAAGIAVAGLGAGVGFTLAANGADEDADHTLNLLASEPEALAAENVCAPTPPPEGCDKVARLRGEQDTFQNLAIAGYVVGGAAAAGAVALAIWSAHDASSQARARLVPLATPHLGGVMIHGLF